MTQHAVEHLARREYWRSLEQLAQSEEIARLTENEFASYEPDEILKLPSLTRRRFMQLMGASMALAGLTLSGCRRWPQEKLVPYISRPKNRTPGVPEQYATIMQISGVGSPLLVTSFDGRPIKVEGNPSHPWSATVADRIGAADAIAQASVLELYDPQRSTAVKYRGGNGETLATNWSAFTKSFLPVVNSLGGGDGQGLAVLSEYASGPTTQRLKSAVLKRFSKLGWYEYEPLGRENEIAGSVQAFGRAVRPILHLDRAAVVVLFDADPLGTHPAHVHYAADWVTRRRSADQGQMSRVWAVETCFSLSGSVADERLPIRPSRLGEALLLLAEALGVASPRRASGLSDGEAMFIGRLAKDLLANRNASVVAVGCHLAPELHHVAMAINQAIGAIGSTLTLHEEPPSEPSGGISDLVARMRAGEIKALAILGGNPAYDAPIDLDFVGAFKSVGISAHLSLYDNETSQLCTWHIPRAHYLETWADARTWDGTITIAQPLIEPLYDGKSCDQFLAFLSGEPEGDSQAVVRKTYQMEETAWRQSLHDGLMPGTALAAVTPTLKSPIGQIVQPASKNFELRFMQDLSVYDGRFAPNGWLQEMPDPMTKLVWDNAALISKKDADALPLENGDMIKITADGRSLEIAAYILPGQPQGVVSLTLGYGRKAAEHIGTGVGFDTYQLRSSKSAFFAYDAQIDKTGESYVLGETQNHYPLDAVGESGLLARIGDTKYQSADIIKEATFQQYNRDPELFHRDADGKLHLQLFDPPNKFSDPHKWGMAIDMTACIGCHACVIACQAENNVPIVGKDQVLKNRQMHWIRIDRYFKGDPDATSPEIVYQPVTCQQCENAPCEQVCPVAATTHDTEGINVMVYNRCVGTRYCSNNCPYKVRRFNFLDYHIEDPRHDKYPKPYLGLPDQADLEKDPAGTGGVPLVERMVFNPEVTVRMRGVMEKCNFCLQRIHNTQIQKRNAGEEIADGDIVTACQQACPTQAIVFGDLNDKESKVNVLHHNDRAYSLLDELLNTRPRNRFLAKISNPAEA
jgi:MoCo/4Fe-4S cofactor protein with predicted Tat translocation signal